MSNLLSKILNKCANSVQSRLPQACALCGARTLGTALCPGCLADLPWLPVAHCFQCARPTQEGALCGHCLHHPPAFVRTRAGLLYGPPLDGLIQQFKYGKDIHLARFFATHLAPHLTHTQAELILPMPLHPQRICERGFNQAVEIARPLARYLDLPLLIDAAQRQRNTPAQAGLDHDARLKNIKGAFTCDARVAGKRVALFDDVMTTGASLNELAHTVRAAGAVEVEAWVVARTP